MSEPLSSTPRADGYRMPGEFEPHAQTWMLWPQRPDNWRLGAKPAQRAWVEVARALAAFEPVTVGVNHEQLENARALLPPEVRVVEIASNDAWMRDCGPTFVVERPRRRAPGRLALQRLGRPVRRPLLLLGRGPARAPKRRRARAASTATRRRS